MGDWEEKKGEQEKENKWRGKPGKLKRKKERHRDKQIDSQRWIDSQR